MYRQSIPARILAAFLVALLSAFSLGSAWAVADDYVRRDVLPKGATIDGVRVGGMTRARATAVVREQVEGPLLQPVTVMFEEKSFQIDPKDYVEVDVEGMVDEAALPRVNATLPERIGHRVTARTTGTAVKRKMRVDEAGLTAWVKSIAPQVRKKAVNARRDVKRNKLVFVDSIPGRALETSPGVATISGALAAGSKEVTLPVKPVPAKFTEKMFRKTLFVRLSRRRVWLYRGKKLEKTYPIAVGTGGFPTPTGRWEIVNKRFMPSWHNPHAGWSAGMPEVIPPGYSNPLGTRALDLNASGIRFHGTAKDYSVGTAASHGCMRMHMWDIEDLYPRVPIGTPVIIIH